MEQITTENMNERTPNLSEHKLSESSIQNTYIYVLLSEKEIDCEQWLLEDKGHIGLTIEMLIEFIYQNNINIIEEIESMFRRIDFKNGDIMHYVNFLAESMVKSMNFENFTD